ncbi:MAG: hypothetical protein E7352_01130 [Clostridiales bacterium]|nr:hypothetical protein [Clostridiales bacterium]
MFEPILMRMIYLFVFILVGFILSRWRFIPENSAKVISKFENMFFVPAMVLYTFLKDCSVANLKASWQLILLGTVVAFIFLLISYVAARFCFKENYVRKVAVYSIAFSNFAFMGYAIVASVFEEIYMQYILFTLPLWFMIYLWGVPVLLIGTDGEGKGLLSRFKAFLNPMFIALIIGATLALTGVAKYLPKVLFNPAKKDGILDVANICMSPLAMILTGATIGRLNLLHLIKKWRVYMISFIKLIIYPLLYIGVFAFVPQNSVINPTFLTCGMIFACMPTGLNSIVIPAAYDKDTSDAAGMALVTHALSLATIPLMFMLFELFVL